LPFFLASIYSLSLWLRIVRYFRLCLFHASKIPQPGILTSFLLGVNRKLLTGNRNALTDSSHSYILQLNHFEFQDADIEKSVEGEEYSQYRCDREWDSPAERFLQRHWKRMLRRRSPRSFQAESGR
jgi:hypothetical protein